MNTYDPVNDDFITKYLSGEASPEEAIQMEEWKASSPNNQHYFDQMQQAYMLVFDKEFSKPRKLKAWNTFQSKIEKEVTNSWIYGIVAALVLGLVTVVFLLQRSDVPAQMLATDAAINQVLSDKTSITLQKNSKITFDEKYGQNRRKLTLSGVAKFIVTHDESLPFIVESNGVFIEDIGTEFEVESRPESDTVYVVVNEGIVRLYDEHGTEIIIKAGEKAWYIRSQKKIITNIETNVVKFDFKNTLLEDAVALLEKTYEIDIQLVPVSIGKCKITTQFFDEEIATIITIITETLGFKYQYQDQQYKIEGKPCQ
ncbi:MAG: FecR family protein [Saprospiraceae bacterium]